LSFGKTTFGGLLGEKDRGDDMREKILGLMVSFQKVNLPKGQLAKKSTHE